MTQKRPRHEVEQMKELIHGDPANGKPGLTLQEVADLFGVTRAAVRYHVGAVGRPPGRRPQVRPVKMVRKEPARAKRKRKR